MKERRSWNNSKKPYSYYLFRPRRLEKGGVGVLLALVATLFVAKVIVGASSNFVQTDWSGGTSTTTAVHPTNQTGWTYYSAKDANVDTSQAGKIVMSTLSSPITETTDTDFNAGSMTNVEVSGTGAAASLKLTASTNDPIRSALGKWGAPSEVNRPIGGGASAVYPGSGNYIYVLRGNHTRDFMRYDMVNKKWDPLKPTPNLVSYGGDLAYPGSGNYIYALRGYYTKSFWRYNITTDTWESLADTPETIGHGGSIVAYDSDTLYVLRGNETTTFWKYTISTNSWLARASTPSSIRSGSNLCYPGSGNYIYAMRGDENDFYRYDVTLNSWTTLSTSVSWYTYGGGDLVDGGDGYLYATFGGYGLTEFARYSISGDSWERLPEAPFMVNWGSALVKVAGTPTKIYALAGWSFNTIEMPYFDVSTQRWSHLALPAGQTRQLTAVVATPNYIFGIPYEYINKFYKFDVATEQWTYVSDMPGSRAWAPKSHQLLWTGSGTAYVDYIYWLCNDSTDEGKLYKYSISANTWSYVSACPDAIDFSGGSLYYPGSGDYAYVIASGNQVNFYKVDLGTGTWTRLADAPGTLRSRHGITYAEDGGIGYLYVAAGYQRYDFYRYDITNNLWTTLTSLPVYIYRPSYYQGADKVLIWPGSGDKIYLHNGYHSYAYEYSISGNSWTQNNWPSNYDCGTQYYPGTGDIIWRLNRYGQLYKYSISSGTWTAVAKSPRGTGYEPVMVMPEPTGDVIYVVVNSSNPQFFKYTISTDTWTVSCWDPSSQSYGFSYGGDTIRIGDYIYGLLGGGSQSFYRYDIANDTWQTLQYTPASVSGGGYLVYPATGGDFIYATRGAGTKNFWKYSISTNTWTALADTLDTISTGAAMAAPGDGFIYLLRGGNTYNYYKYSITGNSWSSLNNSPRRSYYGTEMLYPGSGNYFYVMMTYDSANYFYKYDYTTDAWTALSAYPRTNRGNPSFTYTGGDYIYCLDSNGTPYLYRYSISGDSWTTLANLPSLSHYEGQLEWGGPNYSDFLFAWRGYYESSGASFAGFKYSISGDEWDSPSYDYNTLYYCDWSGNALITNVYYNGKHYLYVNGYGNRFYRYCIEDKAWEKMASPPYTIQGHYGGDMHYPGSGDYIYAVAGYDNSQKFMRYSISGNTWEMKANTPQRTRYGTRIAQGNDGYLYVTRGWDSTTFWRYNMSSDTWSVLTSSVPGSVYYGSDMEYVAKNNSIYLLRGNNTDDFYKFDISTQTWSTMAEIPSRMSYGSGLAYPGIGDYIYAAKGGGRTFFRYSISNDTWEELDPMPRHTSYGDMTYGGDGYIYTINGSQYTVAQLYRYNVFASGEFTSQVLEVGYNAGFGTADWTDTADGQTTLAKVKIRTSDSPTMSGAPVFHEYATDGADMSGLSTVTDREKYLQYKVELKTLDLTTLPELKDITFNYLHYPLEQTLTSSVYDTGQLRNRIMNLSWTETLPEGTDVRLQLRTSPDNSTWSSWLGPASGQKVSYDFSTEADYAKNSHIVLDTGSARLAKELEDFQYKQEVIIDNTGLGADTDVIVTLEIGSGNSPFWSHIQSDGADIRFYDPATSQKLAYNLISFDYTNKSAKVNIRIPSLAADEVKTIYLLYGSADAVSESDSTVLTVPSNGLVGYWTFDEGSGSTVTDQSGNGYTGTGNGTLQWVTGKHGTALSFDGTTSYVDFGDNSAFEGQSGITIAGWAKFASGNSVYIGDKYWDGSNRAYYLYMNASGAYLLLSTDAHNGNYYSQGGSPSANTWHHVAGTWSASDPVIRTYIDGVQVSTYSLSGTAVRTNNSPLRIGNQYYAGSNNDLNGTVDDLVLYNRALTPTEIESLANASGIYQGSVYIPVPEESATSPTLGADWPYREVVTLTNSGSALTDYQIKIDLNSDHNGLWARVQDDGDDIRFVDSDNTTVLNYYLEAFDYANKTATIWVKVPSIPTDSKTIYLYYGNATAAAGSSGDNTFIFFDDFSGTSLDTLKWQGSTGNAVVSGGEVRLNGDGVAIYSLTSFDGDVRVKTKMRATNTSGDFDSGLGICMQSATLGYIGTLDTNNLTENSIVKDWANYIANFSTQLNTISVQDLELRKVGNIISFYWKATGTISANNTAYSSGYIGLFCDEDGSGNYPYFDYFIATKYASPEPTYSFSYPETANTYSISGSYYTDNPTIQPIYGAFYTNDLESFIETSTKPAGTEVKYQISDNGYEWYWWNGSSWSIVSGGYSQANTAAEVNTNLAAFQAAHPNGEFTYRAYFHTDTGSNTPSVDQIDVNLVSGLSYYQDSSGAEAINQLHTDAVDDRYLQYKVSLYSSGQDTPILDDLSLEYITSYITLSSPFGGEVWSIGSTQYITWSYDGLSDVGGVFDETVKIEYSTDGGSTWKLEAASAPNTGTYTWIVDDDHTASARVRITSNGWPQIKSESASNFRIVGTVNLTNPTGGERWLVGTTENITWTSSGTMPEVKLEYSVDNGSSWSPVAENEGSTPNDGVVTNDGTFTWTIPDQITATDTCLIRVSDSVDANTVSTLATPFRIIGAIAVTYPTLNEPLTAGNTYDVTWTSTGTMDQVDLSYSLDGGTTWRDMAGNVGQVTTVTNNDTYSWSVPNMLSETSQLKVAYTSDNSVSDTSENFYIRGFQLNTPNGGEEWELDSTHTISWSSGGTVVLPIKIYLSTDGGITYGQTPITTRYTDTGSYNWTIYSSSYSASDTCKIKVVDSGESEDVSDANFRIMPNPAITVTAPDATSEWMVGTDHNITWTTTGNVSSDLAIEYSVDGGAWTAVSPEPTAQDISNKSYSWTVVDALSTNVKVRIRETTIPTNTDGTPRDTQSYVVGESAVFKITSPTVTITAPTSGTIWVVGDTSRDITWTKVGSLIDPLKLEYSTDAGTTWNLIQSFTQAQYNGTYPWTNIPAGAAGSSVLIKITDSRTPTAVTDTSDAIEILPHQRITLTKPAAGETLIQGDGYNITWTWDGQATTSTLVLKFSEDGGATWPDVPPYRIDDQIPNSPAQYYWVVPEIETTQAKLHIYDANDPLVESYSEVFSITLPKIDITAPVSGNEWFATGTHNITWNTVGFVSSNLSIEYSLDGGAWTAVSPAPTSTQISNKSYPWTVPDSVGSTAQIRITDLNRPAVTDTSGTFSIISPTITITSPTGTETGPDAWVVGTNHDITWTSTGGEYGAISNLVIQYATDGVWSDIAVIQSGDSRITNNSGSYTWTIPDAVSTTARVKIFDGARTATTATSNNFEIKPPSLTITAPNGGENWIIGTSHDITWYSVGSVVEPLKLYYTPDGATWNQITPFDGVNDGTYTWTVPDDYSPGTAKIKIEDSYTGGARVDESDASFTIALPTITVDTPTELWSATDTKAITWSSVGTLIGPLQIEWSTDNFSTSTIISSTVSKDATSLNWTIPEAAVSTNVKIKITDLGRTLTWAKSNAFTVLPIPAITISDPNAADTGADAWRIGKQYTITWSDNGGAISNNLKLLYSVNASDPAPTWTEIATGEANDGSYAWTVPLTASASTDCKVRIYDNVQWKAGTNLTADSATFEIAIPRINITSPAGGEYWAVGDSAPITWTSDGYIFDNLTLQYSLDGGANYYAIASGEANDGSYTWTVPDVTSSNAVIKIIDASSNYGGQQVVAVSNAFNIIATPTITVTAPNGGEVYVLGDQLPITWTSQGLQVQNVKIEYSSDNFVSSIRTIVASTPNDGSYTWTIPSDALSGSTIKVRVSMVGNSSINDVSDANFRIRGGFTITAPIANQRFIVGKSETVTWTTRGTIANVAVKYTADSTASPVVWTTITSSVSNTGSYSFTVPEPRVTTALAKVRIEDASDSTVYAESAAFRADYYTITWRVLDYDTNAPLKQLAVSDSHWTDQTKTIESPVDHDYPYGLYTTFWSKDGYIERAIEWTADDDKTVTVALENQLTATVQWHVALATSYTASTDTLTARVWLERRGKLIGTVATDLADLQWAKLEVFDAGNLLWSDTNTTNDGRGSYSFSWANTGLASGKTYFVKASISYRDSTYVSGSSVDVTAAKDLQATRALVEDEAVKTTAIKTAVESTIPAKIDTAKASIETKVSAVKSETADILTATETTLPAQISSAKTDIETEVEVSRKSKILNRENTIRTGQKLTIRYRTYTGLAPTLTVYDADNTVRLSNKAMTEIGSTGIYEYEVTFRPAWGKGDFTIVASESTKGTLDALIITVLSSDITTVAGQVSAILGTTTSLGDLEDTAKTLNTQIGSIENALSAISKNIVSEVEEAVGTVVDMETVFSKLSEVSKKIKELKGAQKVNLDEIFELEEGKKQDMNYLKNKTNELKAIMELNQKMIDNVANEPLIQTWYEYKSVVIKAIIVNPSETQTKVVPFKVYLPKEAKPEHVLFKGELKIAYDTQQGSYYVYNDYEMAPKESKVIEIEMKDIWVIDSEEISQIRKEAQKVYNLLSNTEFSDRAKYLLDEIKSSLDTIEEKQAVKEVNPEVHISNYRDNLVLLDEAKKNLALARSLLSQAAPFSVSATWKVIVAIIIFLGILSLGFYLIWQKQVSLIPEQEKKDQS